MRKVLIDTHAYQKLLLKIFLLLDYVFVFKLQVKNNFYVIIVPKHIKQSFLEYFTQKSSEKIKFRIKVIYIVRLKISCSFKNYFLIKKQKKMSNCNHSFFNH